MSYQIFGEYFMINDYCIHSNKCTVHLTFQNNLVKVTNTNKCTLGMEKKHINC